ncbi:hypothetical protein NRIC_26650 [Enterococcus florum]|uniref:Gram-positive pilin subunit D1 N-terminal domain-containing protein n=1 Tax=Enterococcus florum TaxID=2480627 RepID=A0A4P5PDX1_9ENTE|nr:pilin N-terminal domain-containing protein [Enterococcus florum]GCF94774.1 hypothetical protein NRIC_26650 [Enterococcus florum]
MKRTYLKVLLCFFVLFQGLGPIEVSAKEEVVSIVLHKRGFSTEIKGTIDNQGQELDPQSEMLKESSGVNGVSFSVYDVTDTYYEALQAGKNQETIYAEMQKLSINQAAEFSLIDQGVTATVEGEQGIWEFSGPSVKNQQQVVYLIVETDSIQSQVSSVHTVLVLDENYAGKTVHLYPKNQLTKAPTEESSPDRLPDTQGSSKQTTSAQATSKKSLPQTNDRINRTIQICGFMVFLLGFVLLRYKRKNGQID